MVADKPTLPPHETQARTNQVRRIVLALAQGPARQEAVP